MVSKNQIKNNKYYSYKYVGKFSGESLYEEEFNSVLYESDQKKAKESIEQRTDAILAIKQNVIIEKQKIRILKENERINLSLIHI